MNSRPTYLEVSKKNIIHNYNTYKNRSNKNIFPVVKANAYGLGMLEMAKLFEEQKVDYLCVATLDEAITLRQADIKSPILVMGYTPIAHLKKALDFHITLTITSLDFAKTLLESDIKNLKFHIKINTSMNRLGFNTFSDIAEIFSDLVKIHNIEGIFTHYAKNDQTSLASDFNKFKSIVDGLDYPFTYIHASSSNSSLSFREDFTNAVRVGIGLYTSKIDQELKNALRLVSHVVNINKIDKNSSVGYEGKYTAESKSYIATIPIGYADGILRQDSGQTVYINNRPYKIIGNICMDQLMLEVDDQVSLLDQVEFFGSNQSLEKYADYRSTIDYEVMAILSHRLERKYID